MSQEHIEGVTVRVGKDGSQRSPAARRSRSSGSARTTGARSLAAAAGLPARLAADAGPGATAPATSRHLQHPRALRRDAVEVDGRRWRWGGALRLADGRVHPGDRTDTWWWSPRLALALRWTIDMHIGGPASLDTRATLELVRVTPAV